MMRSELERAVAAATGETVREIRHRGFGPAFEPALELDGDRPTCSPQVVDWDELGANRPSLFP